jgi:hypothetical protein
MLFSYGRRVADRLLNFKSNEVKPTSICRSASAALVPPFGGIGRMAPAISGQKSGRSAGANTQPSPECFRDRATVKTTRRGQALNQNKLADGESFFYLGISVSALNRQARIEAIFKFACGGLLCSFFARPKNEPKKRRRHRCTARWLIQLCGTAVQSTL